MQAGLVPVDPQQGTNASGLLMDVVPELDQLRVWVPASYLAMQEEWIVATGRGRYDALGDQWDSYHFFSRLYLMHTEEVCMRLAELLLLGRGAACGKFTGRGITRWLQLNHFVANAAKAGISSTTISTTRGALNDGSPSGSTSTSSATRGSVLTSS